MIKTNKELGLARIGRTRAISQFVNAVFGQDLQVGESVVLSFNEIQKLNPNLTPEKMQKWAASRFAWTLNNSAHYKEHGVKFQAFYALAGDKLSKELGIKADDKVLQITRLT